MPLLKDAVEQVVDRLRAGKKPSSNSIKCTQESFRLMNLRHKKGTIGTISKFDNDFSRAAALLEYTVREDEGRIIPKKLLAAAAGINAKNFEKLHHIIGNFRELPTNGKPPPSSSMLSSAPTSISLRKRGEFQESSIPALSIKLGALVHDPAGFAHRAQRLFHDMQTYAKTKMGENGRGQLYDMSRQQKAYEAACFYLIATEEKLPSESRYSKRQNNDMGDEEKIFDIDSIVETSKDITPLIFREVLHHAEKLLNEMSKSDGGKEVGAPYDKRNTRRSRTKAGADSKQKDSRRLQSTVSTSRSGLDANREILDRVEMVDARYNVATTVFALNADNDVQYPRSFLEWRQKVLTQSQSLARDIIKNVTEETKEEISGSRAIGHAADEVLSLWCLSPVPSTMICEPHNLQ